MAEGPPPYCGAHTEHGPCAAKAGKGTDHPGFGSCKHHFGNTEPNIKAANEQAALSFAVGAAGAEVSIDPLEGMLLSVRLSAGLVEYWRGRIDGKEPDLASMAGLERSLVMLNRFTKAALDADVNGRLVALAERAADPIVLAAEEAMAKVQGLTPVQRTVFAEAFEEALERAQVEPASEKRQQLLTA